MTNEEIVAGFNGWLEERINNPEGFVKAEEIISKHLSEKAVGKKVTYGDRCLACLEEYSKVKTEKASAK